MNINNLQGQRFGRLLVESFSGSRRNMALWNCICDCGNRKAVIGQKLKTGNTVSCGCKRREPKHGFSKTAEYHALKSAIARCLPGKRYSKDYFDRGIRVCQQWSNLVNGIRDFIAHIGPRPSAAYSLDRIDNDGNYEPGNVRWATRQEQNNNRRKNQSLGKFSDAEFLAEAVKRKITLGFNDSAYVALNHAIA